MAADSERKKNPYYQGPISDHFNGTRFFNPDGVHPGTFRDMLRWQFGDRGTPWPAELPSPFPQVRPERRIEGSNLKVTMVGHASLLIQTEGFNILTDPVWSERASPFSFAGPKRRNRPGIAMEDLPSIDLVLITHNHYDHLDVATLKTLNRDHAPHFITPLGNDRIIAKATGKSRITVTDWDHVTDLGNDVRIHTEPCHHWSARSGGDRRMALWAAFVIETPHGRIYHIGDTGFHDGVNYRAAAEKHGSFRFANLPIGAYEPQWMMQSQHQNPEEAVEGMRLANIAYAAGHHWGTFRLTNEPHDAPILALAAALERAGIESHRFRALHPGEVFEVPLA